MARENFPPPIIRKRADHPISRRLIHPDALSVLYRLDQAGFTAYLVGGGVRDILLGRTPKDFDVCTDARPQQIKRLFRNAFLIGRRFRLALIRFPNSQIETSTFRRQPESEGDVDDTQLGALYQMEDNFFGTPAEDAHRRDFTINGLFYDIATFSIIDYVGGLRDLERKIIRCIGDPNIRFREDPVRMMRAVRFSARLGFRIHSDSLAAIERHYAEISQASRPRLFEEVLKLFGRGTSAEAFRLLWTTKLLSEIVPALHEFVQNSGRRRSPLWRYLEALDSLPESKASESPGFRLALLLCPLYMGRLQLLAKSCRSNPVDEADRLVREVFVDAFASRAWRVPRAVADDSVAMLFSQANFDDFPHDGPRRSRAFSRPWFEGAVLLYRIRAMATGGDVDDSEAWQSALDEFLRSHPPALGLTPDRDSSLLTAPNAGPRSAPSAPEPAALSAERDGEDADGPPRRRRHRPRHRRRH